MQPQPRTTPEVGGMGHSIKRKEDGRFLRGKGNYVDDVVLPDMLYMDIVRTPYPHAKIVSIDSSRALATPGGSGGTRGGVTTSVLREPGQRRSGPGAMSARPAEIVGCA